jgi:L-seryl-tRNA(Ser) seleniumtransferase
LPHYPDFDVRIESCQSQIGSGSLPVDSCRAQRSRSPRVTGAAASLRRSRALARLEYAGYWRIYDGRMWLDLRCLEDEERFLEMMLK